MPSNFTHTLENGRELDVEVKSILLREDQSDDSVFITARCDGEVDTGIGFERIRGRVSQEDFDTCLASAGITSDQLLNLYSALAQSCIGNGINSRINERRSRRPD